MASPKPRAYSSFLCSLGKFRSKIFLSSFASNSFLTPTVFSKRGVETGCSHGRSGIDISVDSECDRKELETVEKLVNGNLFVYDNFISKEEEDFLYEEVRTSLETKSYQREHWDDAIHGYRESEKGSWSKPCMAIFKKMKDVSFDSTHKLLPYVHVLDLDVKGFIKPHIDSVKFCGSSIAGLSLLSPAIMRFRHDNYKGVTIDALLSRRSLYICRNEIRYEFTHEILPPELSIWNGDKIERTRRISLILRCEPERSHKGGKDLVGEQCENVTKTG